MKSNTEFQIAVGVDGSAGSREALRWAVTEARLRDGHVRALTAWQDPPVPAGLERAVSDPGRFGQLARRVLIKTLQDVDAEGVHVTGEVLQGSATSVLLDASSEADLLVVGATGQGGFTGLLLGSVSTQIIHHARCPVLIIRTGA